MREIRGLSTRRAVHKIGKRYLYAYLEQVAELMGGHFDSSELDLELYSILTGENITDQRKAKILKIGEITPFKQAAVFKAAFEIYYSKNYNQIAKEETGNFEQMMVHVTKHIKGKGNQQEVINEPKS